MSCKNTLLPPPHFGILENIGQRETFSPPCCVPAKIIQILRKTPSLKINIYILLELYSFSKGTLWVWPAQPAVSPLSLFFLCAASIQLQFANLMSGNIPAGIDKHHSLAPGLGTSGSCPMDETFPAHFPTSPAPALFRSGTLGASLALSVHR